MRQTVWRGPPRRGERTSYNADVLIIGVVASVLVAVATWWRRHAGLLLVLAALPWAVHHPSTRRTLVLAGVVAALQVTYALRVAVDRRRGQLQTTGSSALMWAVGVWTVAAPLSLFNLPWASMMTMAEEYRAAVPGRTWWDVGAAWWQAPDNLPHFSVVAAIYTVQAGLLAWIVWREVRQSPQVGVHVAVAQVVGLSVALALALAEAAGGNLSFLRGDELVHTAPGSIQSVTGNRGWFSQYVVYALPFTLVLMKSLPVGRARLVLTAYSVVVLVCLLFAFQRGGWAVGLLTVLLLLVVISSAPVVTAQAARMVCRKSLRVLVTTAAVLLLAVTAVRTLVPPLDDRDGQPHVLGDRLSLASYVSRLQGVDLLGGRERYWPISWDMWLMHPLIGSGAEGFAHRHQVLVAEAEGALHGRRPPVPLPNSAHNIYLQTAVGTGLLGLTGLLAMFLVGLRAMVRTATAAMTPHAERLIAFAAGGSLLAIMIYGLVQEVTYIHALRLMLCCAVGLLAGGESALKREV